MYGQHSDDRMYNATLNSMQLNFSSGDGKCNNLNTCYAMPPTVPMSGNCPSLGSQIYQFPKASEPPVATAFPMVDYGNSAQTALYYQPQFPYSSHSSAEAGSGYAHSTSSSIPVSSRRRCTAATCSSVSQLHTFAQSREGQDTSTSTVTSENGRSRTLFVENIPKTVTLREVINFFKTAGDLEFNERTGQLNVRLIVKDGTSTGEAVVQYASQTGVEKAITMFSNACFPPLQQPMKLTIAYGPYWSSNSDSCLKKLKHRSNGAQSKQGTTGKRKRRIILRDSATTSSEKVTYGNANKAVRNSGHQVNSYFGIPKRFVDSSRSWLCWHCCNMNSYGDTCLFCHQKDSVVPNSSLKGLAESFPNEATVSSSENQVVEPLDNFNNSAERFPNGTAVVCCKEEIVE